MKRSFPEFGYDSITGEWNDSLVGDFLWSNVNVSEAVPDVMTPSTWSLWWIFHYETNPIVLPGNHPFCGNIAGRPYFNLSLLFSVYKAVGQDARKEMRGDMLGSIPADIEIRYSLGRGESGVYTYCTFEHQAAYPAASMTEARYCAKVAALFDWMTMDDQRNRSYPANLHEGDKYMYTAVQYDHPVYGWSSTTKNVGFWLINSSAEYLSGGPTKVEFLCHRDTTPVAAGCIHNYWRSSHYGGATVEVIAKNGAGIDSVDIPEATRRGIAVMVAAGGNAAAVAEHALALLLALRRGLIVLDRKVRAGGWEGTAYQGRDFRGARVGIVGFGSIGRATARMAAALGASVVVLRRADGGRPSR